MPDKIVFNGRCANPSQIACIPNYNANRGHGAGHGAGPWIVTINIGPGAGVQNSNHGPGAGGINSGYAAGAINSNYNPKMAPRKRYRGGNRVGGPSLGGGVRRFNCQRNKYFFWKFPNSWDKRRLHEIFSRYGKISSIFIPRRRDKYGNRFGFVKFSQVPNKKGLETLDKSSADKIRVNPYRRVIKDAGEGVKKTEFRTEEKEKAWLNRCLVGCLREQKDIGMVRKNLDEQGLTSVILPQGNLVLLRFSNEADPGTLLDKGRDILEQHFHWVERWSPNIFKKRYAYIRVMGVPLDAWGERFFTMIGDQCGRFVSMGDSTMKKSRLDFGRVLIATYSAEIISKCLTVRIDSMECKIRVIEEAFQNSDCTVGDGSSDEVEPQSDGNGSLCKGDNMEMLKKIFTGNIEFSNVQNAPQECSLGSKQHNYLQEGDEVVGSSDQGLQEEIIGSEPPQIILVS